MMLVIVFKMFVFNQTFCQTTKVLEEGGTVTINGLKVGFRIVNESSKAAGKKAFVRYELVVVGSNTAFNKLYRNEEDDVTF